MEAITYRNLGGHPKIYFVFLGKTSLNQSLNINPIGINTLLVAWPLMTWLYIKSSLGCADFDFYRLLLCTIDCRLLNLFFYYF